MNWMANAKHRVRIVEKRGREREPPFLQIQKRAKLQRGQKDGHLPQQQNIFMEQPTMSTHEPNAPLTASGSHRRSSDLVLLSPLQMSRIFFDTSPPRVAAVEATPVVTRAAPTATATATAADTTKSLFHFNQEPLLMRDVAKTEESNVSSTATSTAVHQHILYFNNGQQCHEDGASKNIDEMQTCVQELFEGALAPLQHYHES